MPWKTDTPKHQTYLRGLVVVNAFVAAASLALGPYLFVQVSAFSQDLRDGLVKGCERNGNPLREAVSTLLQDQIDQSRGLDYEKFFPTIPPNELHDLIHAQNQKRLALLKTIEPVDCASLYPK